MGVAGAGALSWTMNSDDERKQDGKAIFAALTAFEGIPEREQHEKICVVEIQKDQPASLAANEFIGYLDLYKI